MQHQHNEHSATAHNHSQHGQHEHHHTGPDKHAGHSVEGFLKRFIINTVVTVATVVYMLIDGKIAGFFTFADQIREESFDAIRILREKGIKNLLLTGDNEQVAAKVSEALNMDGYLANVLPHDNLKK